VTDKILFVDDEPSALEGFQRILHRKFNTTTASSGGEGLVRVEKDGPFAVVISDMRMPGMNGADFLARVRQRAPLTVRMLLTGHADLHSAIEAVNKGNILHFLTKPCERDVLVAAINSGLDQYHAVMAEKELVKNARALAGSGVGSGLGSGSLPDQGDPCLWDNFESSAGLPGPSQAKEHLLPLLGKDAQCYLVLLRLPVLETVEQRYGESGAADYLKAAAGFLQQALRAGDLLFHWRRNVLMAVVRRHISAAAIRMEMERLIADTRGYIIEVRGKPMMIACLITYDLLPATQFSDFAELLRACDPKMAGSLREPAPEP
jgi:CheY-like chemotaxis protein